MKALLQIGDDIESNVQYKMRLNDASNSWLKEYMLQPGEYATIVKYQHEQYIVHSEHSISDDEKFNDEFWSYTDDMFDQDLIDYLHLEYIKNNK